MADPNNVVLHEHRLCYMAVPKAASTSIKKRLADCTGVKRTSNLKHVCKEDVARYTAKNNYLSFTIIRHPFTRLVSGWMNKFQNEVDPPPDKKYRPYGFYPFMPFDEYAGIICDTPDHHMDVHFRSQSYDLTNDRRPVPMIIGRFERMEKDWRYIRTRLVQHSRFDPGEIYHYRPSRAQSVVQDVLTKGIIKKLEERFRNDFEIFGYKPDKF